MAGIQLHVDETWPDEETTSTPDDMAQHQDSDGQLGDNVKYLSEKQENLKRKKELIRTNRAKKLSSSRLGRRGKLVKHLTCVSDHEPELVTEVDLKLYLPPEYTTSRKIRELIEVGPPLHVCLLIGTSAVKEIV